MIFVLNGRDVTEIDEMSKWRTCQYVLLT